MRLRFFSVALLICSYTYPLFAQTALKDSPAEPTTLIRWNPFGLLDIIESNVSLGVEYSFRPRWSVSLDGAWIFHSKYYQNTYRANGVIVRPAIRWYFVKQQRNFLELELHYKSTYNQIQDWLGKDCIEGVPSYQEYTRIPFKKESYGLHLKVGNQFHLGTHSPFWLELYAGIGARLVKETLVSQLNNCYEARGIINHSDNETPNVLPVIPIGLRLLYRVK